MEEGSKKYSGVTLACGDGKRMEAHKMSGLAKKSSLEEQMKTLQNHFAAVVSTVKHLKSTVDDLKNKSSDAQEIVETQRVIDEIVVANSDAIRHMKKEISNMKSKEKSNEEGSEKVVDVGTPNVMEEIAKRQQSIDITILKNCDTVKILDEEIKKIIIDNGIFQLQGYFKCLSMSKM